MYTYDNFHKVKEEIEASRLRARAEAEQRSAALADVSPEIAAIDEELRSTGMIIFKTACEGGDISAIRDRNLALNAKRREIIRALGYPDDYTEPKYSCSICSDTGFIDGVKTCSCFRERLITLNIASSGMGKLIEKQSFETFDLEWYRGDEAIYEKMKSNLESAKRYAERFSSKGGNLLIIGSTGTGKTHITTSIAKVVISKGHAVIYDSIENILSDFEEDKFRSGYTPKEPKSEKYLECDLLIIDDLGTEFASQFSTSCIYNIVTTRQNKGLSTIISTNLSPKDLAERYDGRIYSRIAGNDYQILAFYGRDHRIF